MPITKFLIIMSTFMSMYFLNGLEIVSSAKKKDPQSEYSKLKKEIGYDPRITVFHHLRRRIFTFPEAEKDGKKYFEGNSLVGYCHGDNEESEVAYEYAVRDIVGNIYTFQLPKRDENVKIKDQLKQYASICFLIAKYMKCMYKPSSFAFFGPSLRGLAILTKLKKDQQLSKIDLELSVNYLIKNNYLSEKDRLEKEYSRIPFCSLIEADPEREEARIQKSLNSYNKKNASRSSSEQHAISRNTIQADQNNNNNQKRIGPKEVPIVTRKMKYSNTECLIQ